MFSEEELINEPIIVTKRPVTNRHGNVITKAVKSFLPGLEAHISIFCALYIKYQIRANEGIRYVKIFTISAVTEKSAASEPPPVNMAIDP